MRSLTEPQDTGAESLLTGLDAQQRVAVTAEPGVVVVRAGAGSGKTRVLTHRIAWRTLSGTADIERTLAITFTRHAATELRARVRSLAIEGNPIVGTFHAVARRIMIQDLQDRGKAIPVIVQNRSTLMSQAVSTLNGKPTGNTPIGNNRGASATQGVVNDLLALVDIAQSRQVPIADAMDLARAHGYRMMLSTKETTEVVSAYEQLKKRRGLVDLNDFLTHVVTQAATNRRLVESLRFQFAHVLVDEAQDMNPLQWSFLRAIVGDSPDLFLVGDPNQAIYGFNGADNSLFDQLPGIDAPVTVCALPSNYRCTPEIVTFAVDTLRRDHQHAEAVSTRLPGRQVQLLRCHDDKNEIATIVREVRRVAGLTQSFNAVAVLARVNHIVDDIRAALVADGIPVKNDRRGGAWSMAVQTASSLTTRDALREWSCDILDHLGEETSEYSLGDPEVAVAEYVRTFLDENRNGIIDGRTFGSWLATSADVRSQDGVEVLTFHASKGREWPAVIVAGMERGLMPHSRARDAISKSEEARLAYVALTRAASFLSVTWTDTRAGKKTGPSPLLPHLQTIATAAEPPTSEFVAAAQEMRQKSHARGDSIEEALDRWRTHRASIAGISPDGVLSPRHIKQLVRHLPDTEEGVSEIIGEYSGRRFAAEILAILRSV